MSSINVDAVVQGMVGAASEVLSERFNDIRDFAEPEFQKLAQTAVLIARLRIEGRITDEEARLHLRLQRNATQTVFLTVEGLGILAVEQAVNAAIGVLSDAVNTAFGFALF